ncbi:RHS repeat-associated core domain-containing protein [Streptomyces termitum]|uniref:Teneurin-like YD-shell domain-containing protein n=1 Tax=Streptomyces termitum TaxID=67368 RepID=A0A918WBI1_9ACTN|nr:RHS repeat-associated core domain-containing protein [Streptomyces termitum]GHA95386.1 hypothetical protein GCM10010305_43740 [Streptomyces termitum]
MWLPTRSAVTYPDSPNRTFAYQVRNDGPTVVTTRELTHDADYKASYAFYDGLLRARQTQEDSPDRSGRLVTETFYDTRGQAWRSSGLYYATGAAEPALVTGEEPHYPASTDTLYDGAGRVTAVVSRRFGDETRRTTTAYTGDTTTTVPPKGGTASTKVTDALGRTVELRQYTDPARTRYQTTSYRFDRKGRMDRITTPAGAAWEYGYDVRGRQVRTVDPDKGLVTTGYDAGDRPVDVTDSRRITLHTDYDALGRRTAVKKGATTLSSWVYDTVAKGQLSKASVWAGGQAYESAVTSYNSLYKPVGTQLTVPAREGAAAGVYKWTTSYNLNTGQVMWTMQPALGGLPAEKVAHTYTPVAGLLDTVGAGGDALVARSTYDHYGRPIRRNLGSFGQQVILSSVYDEHTGALTESYVDRETAPQRIEDARYAYDPAGNIASVATAYGQDAARTTDTQCFALDSLARITEAWTNTGTACAAAPSAAAVGGQDAYWTTYTYDAVGNRRTETKHRTASGPAADTVRTYTAPPAGTHRLPKVTQTGTDAHEETYTYDAAGNTETRTIGAAPRQSLAWDDQGHLASVTEGTAEKASYLYDTEGQRLVARDADGTTLYLPGGNELRLGRNGVLTGTRYYTAGDRTVAVRTGGKLAFTVADHHGTGTTQITADAAQTVTRRKTSLFGEARGPQPTGWTGDKGFVGGTDDTATGLIHLGAREYDAALGRFVSVDPLFVTDDPRQHNAYVYSDNNPVTLSDPAGTEIGSMPNSCLYDLKYCTNDEKTGKTDKVCCTHLGGGSGSGSGSGGGSGGSGGSGGGGGGGGSSSTHYCDGCTTLIQLPQNVFVPDGGPDVLWHTTAQTGIGTYTDYTTTAMFDTTQDDVEITFAYSEQAMYAAAEAFADQFNWKVDAKTSFSVGLPVLKGGVELTVGIGGNYTWTSTDTETRSATITKTHPLNVKKGDIFGLSPFGQVKTYTTTYHHRGGRTSTRTWGTFDITSWTPVTYSETPPNIASLNATVLKKGSTPF